MIDTLKQLELALQGKQRKDPKWLDAILHKDFREITRSGLIVDRTQTIVALLHQAEIPHYSSDNFILTQPMPESALLTYRTRLSDGSEVTLRSSYWLWQDNVGWQLYFHQGTAERLR